MSDRVENSTITQLIENKGIRILVPIVCVVVDIYVKIMTYVTFLLYFQYNNQNNQNNQNLVNSLKNIELGIVI